MQDARVRTALLMICLACLFGSAVVLFASHPSNPPPIVITPPVETPAPKTIPPTSLPATKSPTRVYVDVAGCVRRPSLYVLPAESRVMQAIIAAGGPTAEADMDSVNLAQKVTDGEKVFIPRHIAPSSPASAAFDAASPTAGRSSPMTKQSQTTKSSHGGKITADSGELINLNTATAEQLERLPSVGPSMAERILEYRRQAGSFGKAEDLMQVTGIGPKKFAKIQPFVKVN